MAKRDYVAEIASRRGRIRRRTPRYTEMNTRLGGISAIAAFVRESSNKDVPFRSEIAKYIPIGTVACLEGYFRLVFRDLIDHGAPFRDNVSKFKEIKIGIDHVVALQSKRVTFGEFVAHLLPASNLSDLNDSMSILIGAPYLDAVKRVSVEYFEVGKEVSLEEDGIADDVFRDVVQLFEQRHIFVHELATKAKVTVRRIAIDYAAATILMMGTEALVANLLAPAT